MSDKIENKVAPAQEDNTRSALSNAAYSAMKEAAIGCALGAAGVGVAAAMADQSMLKAGAAAAAGAMAGGVAGAVGAELAKENKKEINAVGQAIKNEVNRQIKEIVDTPKDLINHAQKRPVTSALESILCPPLWILDAKLRK